MTVKQEDGDSSDERSGFGRGKGKDFTDSEVGYSKDNTHHAVNVQVNPAAAASGAQPQDQVMASAPVVTLQGSASSQVQVQIPSSAPPTTTHQNG